MRAAMSSAVGLLPGSATQPSASPTNTRAKRPAQAEKLLCVISQALLADALDAEPQRRLVSDYARFLVIARNGERVVGGAQLQAWLDTWRPSILGVFAGR